MTCFCNQCGPGLNATCVMPHLSLQKASYCFFTSDINQVNLLVVSHVHTFIPLKQHTVKPVLSGHWKRRQKLVFKIGYRLMKVKSIAECSKGSILQYFRHSLSYYLPLITLFCLFSSGRLKQVLLYMSESFHDHS